VCTWCWLPLGLLRQLVEVHLFTQGLLSLYVGEGRLLLSCQQPTLSTTGVGPQHLVVPPVIVRVDGLLRFLILIGAVVVLFLMRHALVLVLVVVLLLELLLGEQGCVTFQLQLFLHLCLDVGLVLLYLILACPCGVVFLV
jgi:hypothetical protein